jgi:general secretion pathway protein F
MAIYIAKLKTRKGIESVEFSAKTPVEAEQHVKQLKGTLLSMKKLPGFSVRTGLSAGDRQIFFTRMSAMVSSRVSTSDALALMRDVFPGKIQEVSAKLLHFIEAGDDLAAAVERVGAPDFPDATVALIKAAAQSGETHRALKDAAEFERELHAIKSGAGKGMASAIFGFLFAAVSVVASTVYVAPAIMDSPIMKQATTKGNLNFDWILLTGNIIGYLMGAVLLIGLFLWLFSFVGRRIAPARADKIILKIPFYKDLVLAKNNFVVFYGLSLLVGSGVRIEESLRLSAEAAPKGALRRDLQNAYTAVRAGKPWSATMETLHPTDKASLICATDREQVASTLKTLSDQYRQLYGQRLGVLVPVLQTLAGIFLTLAGGVLFATSTLPVLMAAQNIG